MDMENNNQIKNNWIEVGSEGTGLFAKHRYKCAVCGYEMISRKTPKEYCPECAKKMMSKYDELKSRFQN